MKAPRDQETIQIEITNACPHQCSNCTRFCGLHQKPFFMEYETFCKAVDSLLDHPGVIGVMGGEPTLHPRFADMCQYLYQKLPKEKLPEPAASALPTDSFMDRRRYLEREHTIVHTYADGPRAILEGAGLWTTMPVGYRKNFELIQDVFKLQCLNDHTSISYHQPILITRKDMGIGDEEWQKLKDKCWVNQQWSSSITPKGCFFCEVAAALDMLYDGPGGLPIEPGWWKRDLADFKDQFHWCELCGIPLKTFGRDAREGIADVSAENLALLKEKKTAKYAPERVNVVEINNGVISEESKKSVSGYHGVNYLQDASERVSLATPIYAGSFTGVLVCKTADGYEKNRAIVQKNMAYLSELYVVVDGRVYAHVQGDEETKPEAAEKQTLTQFLRAQKEGTYFVLMTPGVKLGEGFEKLKKCVVNPGTLHFIDFKTGQADGANPYIANPDKLRNGVCALLNNNALSLKGLKEEIEFSADGLRTLWQAWRPAKRVELSAKMDTWMLGADDPARKKETQNRRRREAAKYYLRLLRQYGLPTTAALSVKTIKKRGADQMVSRLRGKIL